MSPLFWVGAVIVGLFVVLAIIGPWIAPQDPGAQVLIGQTSRARNAIAPSQPGFLLGGDTQGRDFFSRLVVGARQTLLVGIIATLIGLIGGLIIGLLAGAFGGWVDTVLMRIVDVMLSIPSLLLAISIGVLFTNPNLTSVIIAVGIPQIPVFARLLRGQMLAQRESDHVLAARALGVKRGPDRAPAHAAELDLAGHRAGDLGGRDVDPRRRRAVVPGPRDRRTCRNRNGAPRREAQYRASTPIRSWPSGRPARSSSSRSGFTLLGESLREAIDPKNRR